MARKGENIYKRKDGRWEGRYIVGRKPSGQARYSSVYARSYQEVKEKLAKRKGDRLRSMPSCQLTVRYALEAWLSLRLPDIKESTHQRYVLLIQMHIHPYLGDIRISNLTAEMLSGYIQSLLKNGRLNKPGGLAKKTVNDIVSVLKSALKLAARKYAVDPGLFDVKAPTVQQKPVETLEEWECELLSRSVLRNPTLSGAAYLVSLNTGLRLGELCGLRWVDLSGVERILAVNRTVLRLKNGSQTELTVQPPKTAASRRKLPITARLLSLLVMLRNGAPDDAYILSGSRMRPMEPRTLQYRFKAYLKANGLKHHTIHALRHTFATRSIERGVDPKTLSEILGHKNVKTTLQLYVHPTMQYKRQAMEAVSSILPMVV